MRLQYDLDPSGRRVGTIVAAAPAPALPDRVRVLHGRYARLEPLGAEHAEDLWSAFSADEAGDMWRYLHAGPFADVAEFRSWFTSLCATESLFPYAIVDVESGRALGFASFLRVDPGSGSIEVGWLTYSPALQRNRLATDAMFLMMREAFALGYRRYEWKCNALNLPSITAAHRLGFSFEGLFRQALVVKGRNRDTAWFAVIDADWPRLHDALDRWLDPANFDEDGRQHERLSDLTAPIVVSRWPHLEVEV